MKHQPEWTAARTVDLGYEQLLLVEDERGHPVGALYRGVWLTPCFDPDDTSPGVPRYRPAGHHWAATLVDHARRLLGRLKPAGDLRQTIAVVREVPAAAMG